VEYVSFVVVGKKANVHEETSRNENDEDTCEYAASCRSLQDVLTKLEPPFLDALTTTLQPNTFCL
jgi:hypothetical protein